MRVFDDLAGTAERVEALGGNVLESLDDGFQNLLVVYASPALVNELARIEDVWWIEEKPEFYLMNDQTKWVVQSNVSASTPANTSRRRIFAR